MGSGKSTIGPVLAKRLGRPFQDLDDLIEKEQGMSIAEIFERYGEAYFRELESRSLHRAAALPRSVIALGGGTFVVPANRELVAQLGVSVWLKVPLTLARRRCATKEDRPLARDPRQFEEIYYLRQSFYELADIHISVEKRTPRRICDRIEEALSVLRL